MKHTLILIAALLLAPVAALHAAEAPLPGKISEYRGYQRHDFVVDGCTTIVVVPKKAAPGKPWIWRAEFFDAFPQVDLALLERGFHLVHIRVGNTFGCPDALMHWDVLYKELTEKYGLSRKPVLEGLSRGGLYCFNWAANNPNKVGCIFADNAVLDFKSWPGGKGKGKGSPGDWKKLLQDYHFASEAEALAYTKNPVDNLEPLAKAKVPLFLLCGDADDVVPYPENGAIVKARYELLEGPVRLLIKKGQGHHPHGLDDPTPVVEYILKHVNSTASVRAANPLLVESLEGPVTAKEVAAFKSYMRELPVPKNNLDNVMVYGTGGMAVETLGRMVEVSDDQELLDRMLNFTDALLASDMGDTATIGGLSKEFFTRIVKYCTDKYGVDSMELKACRKGATFEPHVAELVFEQMIQEQPGIKVWRNCRYRSVVRTFELEKVHTISCLYRPRHASRCRDERQVRPRAGPLQPTLPRTGRYQVCVGFRPSKAQATNTRITIKHVEGTAKFTLNQRTETTPFAFVPIGELTFKAGDSGSVDLTNTGIEGRVAIDAVRWAWLGE